MITSAGTESKTIGRRQWRVGIVAPTGDAYMRRVIEGVLRYQGEHPEFILRDFRYANDWPTTDDLDDRIAKWERPWESWKPDGLIVAVRAHAGLIKWMRSANVPLVNTANGTSLPTVCMSSKSIVQKAFNHFRALGFHNVAYVTGIPDDPRGAALAQLVKDAGQPKMYLHLLDDQPIEHDAVTEREAIQNSALAPWMLSLPKPTAILASHDVIARLVCLCAERLGLGVPSDVAVLGTGNHVDGLACQPPLSTIHTPGDAVGYCASEILMRMIRGQKVEHRTEVPAGELIVKESTGAAAESENQIHMAVQLIRSLACEGLSVDELADRVGMSLSTLKRKFQKVRSQSPGAEIATVRSERAIDLLRNTELPIANIAKMTGFASSSRFADFFRKRFGVTPRDYRLKHRHVRHDDSESPSPQSPGSTAA